MKTSALLLGIGVWIGCGSGDGITQPPPPPPPPLVPFDATVTFTDTTRIAGCEYFLIFQANDSSTTVRYSWDLLIGQTDFDGINIGFGETRNATGRVVNSWEWPFRVSGEPRRVSVAYSMTVASLSFVRSGTVSTSCP